MKLKAIIGFIVSLALCVPAFADDVLIKMTKQEFSRKIQSAVLELTSRSDFESKFENNCNEEESKKKMCVLIFNKNYILIISNTENEFVQAVTIKAEIENINSFLLVSSILTAFARGEYDFNGDIGENAASVMIFVSRLVDVFKKLNAEKSDKPSFTEESGKIKLIFSINRKENTFTFSLRRIFE